MKVMNKLAKKAGTMLIYIVSFLEHYIIGFFFMGAIFSLVCTVWSFIMPLPEEVTSNFGKILLTASVPLGVLFFAGTLKSIHPTRKSAKRSQAKEPEKQ